MAQLHHLVALEDFATANAAFWRRRLQLTDKGIAEKRQLRATLIELNDKIERISRGEQQLSQQHQKAALVLTEAKQKVAFYSERKDELLAEFEEGETRLNEVLKEFDLQFDLGKANELFTFLKEKKELVEVNAAQILTLKQELNDVERAIEKKEAGINVKVDRNTKLTEQLAAIQLQMDAILEDRRELFGDKKVEEERSLKQELLNQLEATEKKETEQLSTLTVDLERLKEGLKAKQEDFDKETQKIAELEGQLQRGLVKIDFESIAYLRSKLLPNEEAERMRNIAQSLEKQGIQLAQQEKNNQEEKKKLEPIIEAEEDIKALKEEMTKKEELWVELQQTIGAIKEKLTENDRRIANAKVLMSSILLQEKETNRWRALRDIIGSADGDRFRKFAQGLTLKKLVNLANQHLDKLSGRYVILKPDDEDLKLYILDTFQADNVRSMNTLSGGESFMVSLALALGLSDLAGRNTNIGSLFIDEGFGTLDGNTLDLAISTLENLQSSGKMIGVISHVKELKERITTQIQIKKRGSGVSEVMVVS